MASVFKRKYTKVINSKKVKKQSQKYYTRLIDAEGIKRTIPLYTDKTASMHKALQLKREFEQASEGITDQYKEHRKRPLVEHLVEFQQSLLAKGGTAKHAKQVTSRVKQIVEDCKFKTWTDIQPSKIQKYLAGLRNNGQGISAQTFNFYLKAIKQFCKWMVQDRRAGTSPLEHLKGVNVRTDRRHDRRALEPDDVRRLLEATTAAPERFVMTGYQRATLYRLAVETGLRASELRSLTVSSFDLDNCTVTIQAAYSKHRRQDVLQLRPDTTEQLRSFFAGKMPSVQVFHMPDKTAKMLQADLVDAKIPYVDDSGRYADFHSLRHTTGSWLAANNVHPKVAQAIMRHSDINLTMSRYTHILTGQESEAVSKLPDLSLPSSQKQIATGTDNEPIRTEQKLTPQLTPKLTPTAFSGSNHSATDVNVLSRNQKKADNHKTLQIERLDNKSKGLSPIVTNKEQPRLRGLEPLTFGSVDRRSIQLSYRRRS